MSEKSKESVNQESLVSKEEQEGKIQCCFKVVEEFVEQPMAALSVKPKMRINTKVLRPSGTGFEWCINQYHGCSHGCKYCYGMTIRKMTYDNWIRPRPRKDVITNLQKDIQWLKRNNLLETVKDIFVGSVTDSYQPIELEYGLTRQIIEILKENQLPFTILTKGNAILRDLDLFKNYPLCRAGVTLISLHEAVRKDLEPGATSYGERIKVLEALKANGTSTYLSCEPLMPIDYANPIELVQKLAGIVDLFEFGKWSRYRYKHIPEYYWKNYCDKYYVDVLSKTIKFCEDNKINYCIATHSKDFCAKYGLPFKPHLTIKN
jgi:DNA repair photolyase